MMINKTHLQAVLLLSLLSLILFTTPVLAAIDTTTSTTPSNWQESPYISTCQNVPGTPTITWIPDSVIPLDSLYTFQKQSKVYYEFTDDSDNDVFTQNIFKYFIKKAGDPLVTSLEISNISLVDGSNTTQTISLTTATQIQFLDGAGPLCLMRMVQDGSNTWVLYMFDSQEGATVPIRLSQQVTTTYPNQIFQSIEYLYSPSTPFGDLIGLIRTIDSTQTPPLLIVRQIQSDDGFDFAAAFYMEIQQTTVLTSKIYVNMLFGLQVSGNTFTVYQAQMPEVASQQPLPLARKNITLAARAFPPLGATSLLDGQTFYENHIIVNFGTGMTVASWDAAGQNGVILVIKQNFDQFRLQVLNQKVTTTAPTGSLEYYSDGSSYVIEINKNPAALSFYIIWADDAMNYFYNFINTNEDSYNPSIIEDFSEVQKISTSVFGQYQGDSYSSLLHIFLFKSTSILKYTLAVAQADGQTTDSITLNKDYQTVLDQRWKDQATTEKYQISTQLKCLCSLSQVTSFVCFYGNNGCTFTVQSVIDFCQPEPPILG